LGSQPTTPKTGGTQMVKQQKNNIKKKRNGKGFKANGAKARKINASTAFETCTEQLHHLAGFYH
jgi:hypothetical protein